MNRGNNLLLQFFSSVGAFQWVFSCPHAGSHRHQLERKPIGGSDNNYAPQPNAHQCGAKIMARKNWCKWLRLSGSKESNIQEVVKLSRESFHLMRGKCFEETFPTIALESLCERQSGLSSQPSHSMTFNQHFASFAFCHSAVNTQLDSAVTLNW